MKSKDWKEELRGVVARHNSNGRYKELESFISTLLEEARREGYRSGLEDEIKRGDIAHNLEMEDEKLMHEREIEEAELRGREEENERCVKLIGEIIQNTAWEAPQQFFDGLRCARESIKLVDLTSKEEMK